MFYYVKATRGTIGCPRSPLRPSSPWQQKLHAIATGNLLPSYRATTTGVRPVYFYNVDMSEFVSSKLADRGSLTARSILTNVQDFVVILERGLRQACS